VRGVSAKTRKVACADPLDPQKEAVYAFETAWASWNTNNLTLQECRDAIRWACLLFDVPPPRVKQHNTEAMSECDVSLGLISMQARARRPGRGGKNAATALHEAAHWIVWQQHDDRPQDHGPTFLGVYLRLLTAYGVAPAAALLPAARHFGLKWHDPASRH
jgi:hypothetical protein